MTELNPKVPPWRIILKGSFFGALIGVIFAGNGLCVLLSADAMWTVSNLIKVWFLIMLYMGQFAGPGALVLGAVLTGLLRSFAPRMQSRRRFLVMGMLVGLPLGVFNLLAIFLVMGTEVYFEERGAWVLVFPALAGGAGLGLGCALAVPFRAREEVSD